MQNRFNVKKLWIGVLGVTFAIGLVGCGSPPDEYKANQIGEVTRWEYPDCVTVQKYETGFWTVEYLGAPVIYCKKED